MNVQQLVAVILFTLGAAAFTLAVREERLMQRHRRDGVSYGAATFRRDGGWRRADLFTETGLIHQRRASTFGVTGLGLWIAALAAWVVLGLR